MKAARVLLFAALGIALVFAITSDAQQPSSLNTQLLKAAAKGDAARIQTLLDEGADMIDPALLAALMQGKTAAVKLLLDRGANIEAHDINGDTALLLAAGFPQTDTLSMLIDRGANIHAKDKHGDTALTEAASQGNVAAITLLFSRGTFTAKEEQEALFKAAESEPMTIAMEMPPGGIPPNPNQNQPMPPGLPSPHSQNKLMEPAPSFAPPDYAGTVKALLEGSGLSVDQPYDDYGGETLLIHAASFGQTHTVKVLLAMGAKVDATDKDGGTALLAAACNCAVIDMPDTMDSVRLLLDAGANVEARGKDGTTPLMAAGTGQPDNVKLLLYHGAKIDARDNHGDTALTLAARAGYGAPMETVRVLVERGADVNARNQDGDTALLLAASVPYYNNGEPDNSEMVRLLLAHGADPRVANRKGQTALSMAMQSGQGAVVNLLRESLAKPR